MGCGSITARKALEQHAEDKRHEWEAVEALIKSIKWEELSEHEENLLWSLFVRL